MTGSNRNRVNKVRRIAARLALLLLLVFFDCHALVADTNTDRRITVGLKLFPVLLAADTEAENRTGSNGHLNVQLLYVEDRQAAEHAAQQLALDLENIRGTRVDIRPVSLSTYLDGPQGAAPLALFLTERLNPGELQRLVRKASAEAVILFSPFEGDVEKGVLAGVSVQASVRPYLNKSTLAQTGVALKPFFLKVAKLYE